LNNNNTYDLELSYPSTSNIQDDIHQYLSAEQIHKFQDIKSVIHNALQYTTQTVPLVYCDHEDPNHHEILDYVNIPGVDDDEYMKKNDVNEDFHINLDELDIE